MTLETFIFRLVLVFIFGLFFVFAMKSRGSYNSIQTKSPKATKVIGWIFVGISVLQLAGSLIWLSNCSFPTDPLEYIRAHSIVRDSSHHIVWGMPTEAQNFCINLFTGVFASLAFALYFLNIKKSDSKWYAKISKVLLYIFSWAVFIQASNFHYFDFWEFTYTILFFVCVSFLFKQKQPNKSQKSETPVNSGALHCPTIPQSEIQITKSDFLAHDETSILSESNREQVKEKTAISIKPFFWIGLTALSVGFILCLCLKYTGVYVTNGRGYYYGWTNSSDFERGIYPKAEYENMFSYQSYLFSSYNNLIRRAKPFGFPSHYYSYNDSGNEIWVYNNKGYLNEYSLKSAFSEAGFPDEFFSGYNDTALGESAFSYCFADPYDGVKSALVFIYEDNLVLVLSSGESVEQCGEIEKSMLSMFEKYDYTRPHITISDFKDINYCIWCFSFLTLLLYVFLFIRKVGGIKALTNKRAKVIAILNTVYVIGWFVFCTVLYNTSDSYERETYPSFIAIWLIVCPILSFALNAATKPYSEFFLFPKWLKSILEKRNLNTQLVYRVILLFILWPLFYLCLLPVVGFIPCIYTASASALLALILVSISLYRWIKRGKGIKVE